MYQLLEDKSQPIPFVRRMSDLACIPFDPDNTDYQAYLKWVADGGTPLPAESN